MSSVWRDRLGPNQYDSGPFPYIADQSPSKYAQYQHGYKYKQSKIVVTRNQKFWFSSDKVKKQYTHQIIVEACLVDVAKNAWQSKKKNAEIEAILRCFFRDLKKYEVRFRIGTWESIREHVNLGFLQKN